MTEVLTPLELTRTVRDISVTERNAFKGCRRRWYLETIENLEPRGVRNWAFDFGSGIHAGLEAFYKAFGDILEGDPLERALEAFDFWYETTDAEIKKADLGPSESEFRNELLEYRELGRGMLENYNEFSVLNDDWVICCVEGQWTEEGLKLLGDAQPPYDEEVHPILHESGRFLVPILEEGDPLDGPPYLSSRLDLIVYVKKTGLRGFWIIDHKTTSSSPSDRGIEMDDQVTGYGYTFWRHTGIVPRGTVFNYLIKQLPKPPRLVRNDTDLSSAKDQLTTADLYREALIEFGYWKDGRVTSEKHAECYESLLAHGWGRFFKRISTPRNESELRSFEERLVEEYDDMVTVYENPTTKAYPHLSQYNCPGCPVAPICKAIEDGSDYEFIIENKFQQAPDRKAI